MGSAMDLGFKSHPKDCRQKGGIRYLYKEIKSQLVPHPDLWVIVDPSHQTFKGCFNLYGTEYLYKEIEN